MGVHVAMSLVVVHEFRQLRGPESVPTLIFGWSTVQGSTCHHHTLCVQEEEPNPYHWHRSNHMKDTETLYLRWRMIPRMTSLSAHRKTGGSSLGVPMGRYVCHGLVEFRRMVVDRNYAALPVSNVARRRKPICISAFF